MSDPASQGLPPSPPTNVPDLIDDYRKRQEAWRLQSLELARLRTEMLAATERRATAIVTTVRAEVRRLIVAARGELLELATEVQAITESKDGLEDRESVHTRDRLLEARRDIHRVLDESASDLEALRHIAIVAPPTVRPIGQSSIAAAINVRSDETQQSPRPGPIETAKKQAPLRRSSFVRSWVVAFALIGLMILVGTTWWMSSGRPAVAPKRTVAAPAPALAPQASDQLPVTPEPQTVGSEGARRSSLSLAIEAQRPAWIQATIDGRTDAGRILRPGDTQTIDAERDVQLRVGDAGAVLVSRNGAEREALGRDGQVVTRRFDRGQAQRPAAAIASPSPPPPPPDGAATPSRGAAPPAAAVTVPRSPAAASPAAVRPSADAPPSSSAKAALPDGGASAREAAAAAVAGSSAEMPPNAAPELTRAAERWLDAFYRRHPSTSTSGAASDVMVSDERGRNERPPAGLPNLHRTLEQVRFQFVAESAILTARMTEQANGGEDVLQYVSWVSLVWIREAGQWRLLGVRFASDTKKTK